MSETSTVVLNTNASAVATRLTALGVPSDTAFDPSSLLVIASVIIQLVKLLVECSKMEGVEAARDPGRIGMVVIRAKARRASRQTPLEPHWRKLAEAVALHGKEASEEEIVQLIESIR